VVKFFQTLHKHCEQIDPHGYHYAHAFLNIFQSILMKPKGIQRWFPCVKNIIKKSRQTSLPSSISTDARDFVRRRNCEQIDPHGCHQSHACVYIFRSFLLKSHGIERRFECVKNIIKNPVRPRCHLASARMHVTTSPVRIRNCVQIDPHGYR
jgi:hypothetical protein